MALVKEGGEGKERGMQRTTPPPISHPSSPTPDHQGESDEVRSLPAVASPPAQPLAAVVVQGNEHPLSRNQGRIEKAADQIRPSTIKSGGSPPDGPRDEVVGTGGDGQHQTVVSSGHHVNEHDESQDQDRDEDGSEAPEDASLDFKGTLLLAIQHTSSSWGYRCAEFAFPLYFVQLFTNTLLPASLYGFLTTGAAILFSGWVGGLVDSYATHRLRAVRAFILAQKTSVAISYGLFLVLFYDATLTSDAANDGRGQDGTGPRQANVWSVFAAITLVGCAVILSNVGVSVAVERDWVTSISDGSSARLVRLNAIIRRIDLLSKLVSPLFVSLLTSTAGYGTSAVVLLGICAVTTVFELTFIGIVFRRFPLLGTEEARARQARAEQRERSASAPPSSKRTKDRARRAVDGARQGLVTQSHLWNDFARMPIFISSCSISLLYMSVLSFDSTFIAYLKSSTSYTDAFIAGMRSICVVTGLAGTLVSPWLTSRIGLVRTGSYSLWAELLPLTLALVALWVGAGPGRYRPPWNTALLFLGLALSRVGLWSFDLAQLAQVQTALSTHPRRNSLMGLQFSLQNLFDLGHYGLTLGWNRPEQLRNAAAASYAAVGLATALYVGLYARRERGHLLHLDRLGLERLLGRKGR